MDRTERSKGMSIVARASKKKAAPSKAKLLFGGNPQVPKGDGEAPVRAYIAAMPGWKKKVGRHLDALIEGTVPGVRKAVRWNTPFYGVEGQGWFLAIHCYTKYVQVTFLHGEKLHPPPPKKSKQKSVRYLDIHEDFDLDDEALADWIRQASSIPGESLF